MSPLEERVEQLEKRVELLKAQLTAREVSSATGVSHVRHRHHARRPFNPEQAIQRARQQNSLWLMQGMRVIGLTVLLCFLCWGGVVLFERAEEYFEHQPPVALVNPPTSQP